MFATIFLIIVLYGKIRISYIRYATIILILLAGVIVPQGQFKGYDEYTYGSTPDSYNDKEKSTASGIINSVSNSDISLLHKDSETCQQDSLRDIPDITGIFPDKQITRYPNRYDMIYAS